MLIVIARDGGDPEAKGRRAAVRPSHLERIAPLVEGGQILLGGAILDDQGEVQPFRPAVGAWMPDA